MTFIVGPKIYVNIERQLAAYETAQVLSSSPVRQIRVPSPSDLLLMLAGYGSFCTRLAVSMAIIIASGVLFCDKHLILFICMVIYSVLHTTMALSYSFGSNLFKL